MTTKADFNAKEWSEILEAPPIAGLIVITAQRGGTLRETIELAKSYVEARKEHGGGELLDEILAAKPEMDPKAFDSAQELHDQGLERLRGAVGLLESKASADEVEAYKGFVITLAENVAKRHKEGGFLGVGGEEVSENESTALDEIAAALGTERTAPS